MTLLAIVRALWTSLSNWGRKRPSISWLVENIYDWLVPQRLLPGRAPTGKSKTEQNSNDTPSVLVRGYDWDKETDTRDADCILMLKLRHTCMICLRSGGWSTVITTGNEWIPSVVSIDLEKISIYKNYDFLHAFLPDITWFSAFLLIDGEWIDKHFHNLLIIGDFQLDRHEDFLFLSVCCHVKFWLLLQQFEDISFCF